MTGTSTSSLAPPARIPTARSVTERVAIVTGAAVGLGRVIAGRLATEVSGLVLVDRDQSELGRTAGLVERPGLTIETLVADVTEHDAPARVASLASARFGGADVLINNAGVVDYAPFFETTPPMLRRLLAIDVESVYFMSQAFARDLVQRGAGGSIVNLGTMHALRGVGGTSGYAAAKGAIHSLTRALSVELAPHGIRVNTLALGMTLTARVVATLSEETMSGRLRQIPLRRGAQPSEAADAVVYLVNAEYATGTELVLDGGFTIFGDA
jgi:NAD(P)-dependent dehydrogenase (short-subunit alcohol dehydrogenase family)